MTKIIGIDLGTSTSEVACVIDGAPVVIPNDMGEVVTPSVVHIAENGDVLVGADAMKHLLTRPDCTFMEVKRMFGTDEKLTAHGREYAPEEIQSHLLRYLADNAREYLGEAVASAVITVPAYFTDGQRRQTIRAGELAGLKVERIINEPTAAALDYGMQNLGGCENILVYDLGGGTLDVTVLELFEGVIDVKSSCGNNRLGGKDFDEALMRRVAGKHYEAIKADPRAAMRLKQAAIDCKIALGAADRYDVRLPFLKRDGGGGGALSIERTISREEFEGVIASLVESTGEQIRAALSDAGLASGDLQKVLLVGGSVRVPLVRRVVGEILGSTPDAVNFPELTVARGAAVQAAIIGGEIADEQSVVLTDVCPFTLGAKVASWRGLIVDPLIRRNVTIPCEFSKLYHAMDEYQPEVRIPVYQGESPSAYEDEYLGVVRLSGLPRRKGQRAEIEVTFAYDVNGILQVTARATGNDSSNTVVIDINSIPGERRRPVRLSEWESAPDARKYRPLVRKVLKILDEHIGTEEFSENHLYAALDEVDRLKSALLLEDGAEAEECREWLEDFLEQWAKLDEEMEEETVELLRKTIARMGRRVK